MRVSILVVSNVRGRNGHGVKKAHLWSQKSRVNTANDLAIKNKLPMSVHNDLESGVSESSERRMSQKLRL